MKLALYDDLMKIDTTIQTHHPNRPVCVIPPEKKRSRTLRELLYSPSLEFIMEAHNGLSARIVEEAGFSGIWASSLTMSAQFGVRDSNEASWTQIVDMLEFMSDAVDIPILLDGDTGYGNFNNVRRLVNKLEQRGIGGVCIEDKLFPKTNSFINGERQALCDIDVFCSKIEAGRDCRIDPEFCIVARIEALIAGWGIDEAIRRAEAYREAGADGILIHSKQSRADEVLEFAKRWKNRLPVVIVPTKYYSTPTSVFREAGISLVIWANHLLRASISSMADTARDIYETETLVTVEDTIAPVNEIFRLQGAEELLRAEQQYLRTKQGNTTAIILAASRGRDMDTVTKSRPKVMIPVAGKPLLRRLIDEFKQQEVHQITVVAGYQKQAIAEIQSITNIDIAHNPRYEQAGELASLTAAREAITEDTIITYGDLLFRSYILRDLLACDGDIVIVVDSLLPDSSSERYRDLVYCSEPDRHGGWFGDDVHLLKMIPAEKTHDTEPDGRWIGMIRLQGKGRAYLLEAIDDLADRTDGDRLSMCDLINQLLSNGRAVKVLYVQGN